MSEKQPVPTYVKLADQQAKMRESDLMPWGLSYDDIVLNPGPSVVTSPDQVSLETELVDGIKLHIPIVSANMTSVTEAPMAKFMAQVGGIGIIHRALSIDEQVAQVHSVKDAMRYRVEDPPKIRPDMKVAEARALMLEHNRGYVLVIGEDGELLGLASTRDLHQRLVPGDQLITNVMTPRERLVVAPPGISMEEAQQLLYQNRVEKLPLVRQMDGIMHVEGVITDRDLNDIYRYPHATKDDKGRLRVGAAIGVQQEAIERAEDLIRAGVDVLVIDVLHGDSPQVHQVLQEVKRRYPSIPVIAGNVATGKSTLNLIRSGADAVKVGYGDGSVCTTRVVTGTGRSQATAVMESSAAAYHDAYPKGRTKRSRRKPIPINADGSIRSGGDIVKALASGARTVMVGSVLAGTDQTPGRITKDEQTGERYKTYMGMASTESRNALANARKAEPKRRAAQGTSVRVPYRGDAGEIIYDLVDGVKHGIANLGARDIDELQEEANFERQTSAGYIEGLPHGTLRR